MLRFSRIVYPELVHRGMERTPDLCVKQVLFILLKGETMFTLLLSAASFIGGYIVGCKRTERKYAIDGTAYVTINGVAYELVRKDVQ